MLASTALAQPALAQEASILPFPIRQFADENGVDLLSGVFTAYSPGIRIGSAEMGLGYIREVRAFAFRDTAMGTISSDGASTYTVDIAGNSEAFTLSGGTFTPVEQNGSTLVLNGTTYTYTRSDGTSATFDNSTAWIGVTGVSITSLTYPSGRTLTYYYTTATYTDGSGVQRTGRRLQSVTTNAGYHMKLSYQSDTLTSSSTATWARIIDVKGLNSSTDSCSVTAFSCPQTGRPELSIPPPTLVPGPSGYAIHTYVDAEGRTTTFRFDGPLLTRKLSRIRLPGSTADDISVSYNGDRVNSVTKLGVTTTYGSSDAGNVRTVTVTRPGGATRVLTFDLTKSVMLTDRDELNRTTSYQYDANNRLTRVTRPEGNYAQLTYDGRGNVTEQRQVSKTAGTPADIAVSASYPASCANAVTCNKPTSTTDARGNTTDFTYDTTHGGVLTVTAPAPSVGAVRPETRVSYARLDSNGAPSASGIFRPTGSSTCQTGSAPACVGTADEVKTTIAYGQGLLPSAVTKGAGDSSLTTTSAMTYDAVGNLLTVDGPLAGTADTIRYRYNFNRELVGMVSADPDGAGSLKHRAQRVTRDGKGLVTKVEVGTVNSQSDADWAAFVPVEEVQGTYDGNRRLTEQRMVSSGTSYALTQNSYDSRGRLECVAMRMNPAVYGSLPASACSLSTQGSFGADRITKPIYDAASEVTEVRVNVATAAEASDRILTYTSNGRVATLKDAENNLTTYEYDGHDRLSKTRFPVAAKGAGTSSTTDFAQLIYETTSGGTRTSNTVASLIPRGGSGSNPFNYVYDTLGRLITKGPPNPDPTTAYAYDNLGRLTSATLNGNSLTFTYDALSRNLTQVGPQATVSSCWDAAGRRTRLVYDGSCASPTFYMDYDYLVTGEMAKIRENGATSGIGVLAAYAYDDLGRRTSLAFGNGTSQSFAYDPVSRLEGLKIDLVGTSNDLVVGKVGAEGTAMSYNPASQIIGQARSNDSYAWIGSVPVNRSYTSNGLNQYTQSGSIIPTYDARGNLTSAGPTTYTYTSENMLATASGGVPWTTLGYDPGGRLAEISSGGVTTRFGYDGRNLIAEYDGSNAPLRRYVHGPGIDQPIVWYEGSGTTDRRFLGADERGSVIAVSDSSGNRIAANSYDEYGIPGASNVGRFQYTGQTWLPELGTYYYKARIYSPTLGRFLQTDPIGYAGGINLFAYVKNDPINYVDPSGMRTCHQVTVYNFDYYDLNDSRGWDPGEPGGPGQDYEYHEQICIPDIGGAQAFGGGGVGGIGGVGGGGGESYPGHFFRSDEQVSKGKCNLTDAERAYLTQHFATPFSPGTAAINGRVELFGSNPILQRITNNGQSVINTTLYGHKFHSDQGGGQVVRAVSIGENGAAYSSTLGTGTNYSSFWAGINMIMGPITFGLLDYAMADYIEKSGICN